MPKRKTKKRKSKVMERWRCNLLKAADILEKKGWTRGRLYDGQNYCVHGALAAAITGKIDPCGNYHETSQEACNLAKYIQNSVLPQRNRVTLCDGRYLDANSPPTAYLASWNDSHSRTRAEVLKALRGAAVVGLKEK